MLIEVTVGCGKRFDSFCPDCAKRWRTKTFVKYYRGVFGMKNPRFLTLTLKKSGGRIEKRLMLIWEMKKLLFKYLARRGYKIASWLGVIEPPNHIHLVVDTKWIPQHEISNIWKKITGDSFIVDIRPVSAADPRKVAAYITKYLTKASSWEGVNLDLLKGFHLIGSWKLPPKPPKPPDSSLCICGTTAKLVILTDEGFHVLYNFQEAQVREILRERLGGLVRSLQDRLNY